MKHAILVMGYGDYSVLQETINVLDDNAIDFIVHWDKKYKIPSLISKKSNIFFLKNRIKVNWGTNTQVIVERKLIEYVLNSKIQYDYVHLISSNDMPLMTADYFKNYFGDKAPHIGFIDYYEKRILNNVRDYYPIRHLNVRGGMKYLTIITTLHYLNRIFRVNRMKNSTREKGCNWFSMDIRLVKRVAEFDHFNWFLNTYTGDEFYVQTILKDLKPEGLCNKYNYYSDAYRMTKSSEMAARYVNWIKGYGFPYNFKNKDEDINDLKSRLNTRYAFARKLNDAEIVKKVFDYK